MWRTESVIRPAVIFHHDFVVGLFKYLDAKVIVEIDWHRIEKYLEGDLAVGNGRDGLIDYLIEVGEGAF